MYCGGGVVGLQCIVVTACWDDGVLWWPRGG